MVHHSSAAIEPPNHRPHNSAIHLGKEKEVGVSLDFLKYFIRLIGTAQVDPLACILPQRVDGRIILRERELPDCDGLYFNSRCSLGLLLQFGIDLSVVFLTDDLFPGAMDAIVGHAKVIPVASIQFLDEIVARAFSLFVTADQAEVSTPLDI